MRPVTPTNIRAAAPRDIPQLLSLIRRYWEFEQIADFQALRIEMLLQRLLDEPRLGAAWVAEESGRIAGYLVAAAVLSLEHGGLMAEIDELFVLPEQRARGIGAQLLAAAESTLAARGYVRLQLQLGVDNAGAQAFYERHGYCARGGYRLLEKELTGEHPEG